MLSNGHTLSSTLRCYHLILMTIKTFLMRLFYPNFSYHLMSDQIISSHFFPAHRSSLRSLWHCEHSSCADLVWVSGYCRCQTCTERPHDEMITQSWSAARGSDWLRHYCSGREVAWPRTCEQRSPGGPVRDISTFEVDRRILKNCLRDGKVLNIPNTTQNVK